MECPHCGNYESRVIKTYENIKDNIRVRIRICLHCGSQIPTTERIDKKSFRKRNPKKPINYDED
jgi:transcriptional regulator NrdR family protein